MQIIKIETITAITAAFVALTFKATVPLHTARITRQVILPLLTAPGVGELSVYLHNREDRPHWMKSPLLCYHGRAEAMGRPNHGGLYQCREWHSEDPAAASKFSLVFPRMSEDPLYQQYVEDGMDVTEFYLGGVWRAERV